MIYIEIDFSLFCDQFARMGRADSFSYEAKQIIFDYLEESGNDIELDVIALCCEYEEKSILEIIKDYDLQHLLDYDSDDGQTLEEYIEDNQEETREIVQDYLFDNTTLLGSVTGGFVYACF